MKRPIPFGKLIIAVFLFSSLSCGEKDIDTSTYFQEKLNNLTLMDSLNDRVIYYGDTIAYRQLRMIHYMAQQRQSGFLFYSLVMSNKYNYDLASYDVFFILTNSDSTLDTKSKELADYYLEKSKLKDDPLREFR